MNELLVVMPYFNVEKDIFERALKSILKQSVANHDVLVISDGCQSASEVTNIRANNLTFYDLEENRGRYFIDAIAQSVSPYPLYMPTDADDVSAFRRLEYLFKRMHESQADVVLHMQKVRRKNGSSYIEYYPLLKQPQINAMRHLAHHSGIYKIEVLKNIGYYSPMFRCGYDTLSTNLIKLQGIEIGLVPRPLLTREYRGESLTNNSTTGFGTPARKIAARELSKLYSRCFRNPHRTKKIMSDYTSQEMKELVELESKKLKEFMQW